MPYTLLLVALEITCLYLAGGLVRDTLAERIATTRSRPRRWCLYALVAPGVIVHELSHVIAVIVSFNRLERAELFHPRITDTHVQLGEVQPRLRPGATKVTGAWIGLAPLWIGPLLCYVAGALLIPGAWLGATPVQLVQVAALAPTPQGIAWLALLVSVSVGLLPSQQDHQDVKGAAILLLPVALVLLALAVWAGPGPVLALLDGPSNFLALLLAAPAVICLIGAAAQHLVQRRAASLSA